MVTLILATLAGVAGVGLALLTDPIKEQESESE
jgi:hypothetical protein